MIKNPFTYFSPTLGWVTVIRSSGALGFALSIPFLALYLHEELLISMTYIGLMMTISGLLSSSIGALGGALSDRVGRRKLIAPLFAARAVVFFIIAWCVWSRQPFLLFAALWTISGLLGSATHPAMDAIIADIVPSARRAEAYGILRVGANVGWGLGPAIGGFIMGFGYHWLFLMTAFIVGFTALLAQLKVPETWTPSTSSTTSKSSTIRLVKEDPYVVIFLLVCLCLTLVRGQLLATLSVHASGNIGLSKPQIGTIFFLNALMVIIMQVPLARAISRFKPLVMMSIAGVLYAIGYFGVGISQGYIHVIISIIIVTFGELIESPTATSYVSRLAPIGKAGAYMGGYSLVISLGWATGPLIGGFLLDHLVNPLHTWIVIASMAIASSIGFVLIQSGEKKALIQRANQGLIS